MEHLKYIKLFNEIGRDIKKILLLYRIACKTSNKAFLDDDIIKYDCQLDLNLKFPEIKEDFENLWKEVNIKIKKYNLSIKENFWGNEQELIYNHYKQEIKDFIINKVKNLDEEQKIILYLYLKNSPEYSSDLRLTSWNEDFKKELNSFIDIDEISMDYFDLLISLGLIYKGIYIDSKGANMGMNYCYSSFFKTIKPLIIKGLKSLDLKGYVSTRMEKEKEDIIHIVHGYETISDLIMDLKKELIGRLDDIKSDTELIKDIVLYIENMFDKIDDLESFLKERLESDFNKIKTAWEDYKAKKIGKKELIKEGLKIIGKNFIKVFYNYKKL